MSALSRFCRLWRRQSKHGTEYFVGRVGDIRVVVMPRRSGDTEDSDHDFEILFGEAAAAPALTAGRPDNQVAPPAAETSQRRQARRRPRLPGQQHQLPEDVVPF